MKTKATGILTAILLAFTVLLGLLALAPHTAAATETEVTEVKTWNELLNAVNSDKTSIKLTNSISDIVPDDELPTKHRLVFDGGKNYLLDFERL